MLTPRPYQVEGIDAARAAIRRGVRRLLLVLATGGGKTVVAALVFLGMLARGKRGLFLAHRREIVLQARAKLLEAGIPEPDVGVIMASAKAALRRPNAAMQVASVQTLVGRPLPPVDVLFVDEAHHSRAESYIKLTDKLTAANPKLVTIGLTATPIRGDGKGLKDSFDELLVIRSFLELAAEGYLTIPRVYSHPHTPDLSGVKTSAGDYQQDQLAAACDKASLVGDIVEHWKSRAEGRTTAVFAASVEHSKHIVEAFRAAGVAAEHLDCHTPTDEREAILARMATGETRVVANMGVLTEGWDLPRCKCIVLARPTKCLGLYLQMAGRGLRPWEGTEAILLDHAGCAIKPEFGLPQEDREWSLEGKKKIPGAPPVKVCPVCYLSVPSATRVCPGCGHVWEVEEREGPEEKSGTLEELTPEKLEEIRRAKARKELARAVWKESCSRAGISGWARTDDDREAASVEAKTLNILLYRRFGKRETLGSKALKEALAWVEGGGGTPTVEIRVTPPPQLRKDLEALAAERNKTSLAKHTAASVASELLPIGTAYAEQNHAALLRNPSDALVYRCSSCGAVLRHNVPHCYACSVATEDASW